MTDTFTTDKTINIIEKSLNVLSRRQSLLSTNISNIHTKGYTAKDLDFHKTLEKEIDKDRGLLKTTKKNHYSHGYGEKIDGEIDEDQFSLESVDIDKQMTSLAENNIRYKTSVEFLLRKYVILKYAVNEGGR